MTNSKLKIEKDLEKLIKFAQPCEYIDGKWVENLKPFCRLFAGRVREALNEKNPLGYECLVIDIQKILGIIDPNLKNEVEWFKKVIAACTELRNDRIRTHRMLGITNDNQ